MIALVLSSCLALASADPPPEEPSRPALAPTDVVAALETAISDAIAKAEPSVVAIHRFKGEPSQETQAVRGRRHRLNPRERQRLPAIHKGHAEVGGPDALFPVDDGRANVPTSGTRGF